MKTAEAIQQWYLDNKGNYCPICESEQIEARDVEVAGVTAVQEVVCHACKSHWLDKFTLTELEILEEK